MTRREADEARADIKRSILDDFERVADEVLAELDVTVFEDDFNLRL
jgi:hypothetical protein